MTQLPLRYNISDWKQLTKCLSNNSSKLHIAVTELTQADSVSGTVITVYHDDFGTLFSYLVDADGPLITTITTDEFNLDYLMSLKQLLNELARYGFLISFNRKANLSTAQVAWLSSIKQLGFEKIRILTVTSAVSNKMTPHLVVFNIAPNSKWLDNMYSPYEEEFMDSLAEGSAVDLSQISEASHYRWDWLDYVANIQDVLDENIT